MTVFPKLINWRRRFMAKRMAFCAVMLGALLVPATASAQLFGGVFGAYANDSFDGTYGVGGELGLNIPVLPLDVFGSGTWYFPDCDNCDLSGWSLGANLRIPMVIVRPYLTGGWTWRDIEGGGATVNPLADGNYSGVFAGAGIDLALFGVRLFAEGRREFLEGELEQFVFRGGVLLR
jgi:hypothetical protein